MAGCKHCGTLFWGHYGNCITLGYDAEIEEIEIQKHPKLVNGQAEDTGMVTRDLADCEATFNQGKEDAFSGRQRRSQVSEYLNGYQFGVSMLTNPKFHNTPKLRVGIEAQWRWDDQRGNPRRKKKS